MHQNKSHYYNNVVLVLPEILLYTTIYLLVCLTVAICIYLKKTRCRREIRSYDTLILHLWYVTPHASYINVYKQVEWINLQCLQQPLVPYHNSTCFQQAHMHCKIIHYVYVLSSHHIILSIINQCLKSNTN